MTARELKNAILQLAVQGRLVPQNPDDEPASELLKRIHAEKEQLVKKGKIKKEKLLPPISEDEILFMIPESWEWVRLASIVFNRGQETPTKPFCYIDIGSIDNKHQRLGSDETVVEPENAPSRARKIVELGDIIYATVRPYLHNTCIIDRQFSRKPIASTGFAAMACHEGIYNQYLLYFLISPVFDQYANSIDNAKGMAYPAINDKRLYRSIIPLPPFAEQKRIVEKIQELMPLVEEYGKAEEHLAALNAEFPDTLRKSILQQAIQGKLTKRDPADEPAPELLNRIRLTRNQLQKNKAAKKSQATEDIDESEIPFDLPENWTWAKLGWIAQKVGAGSTPQGGAAVYVPHGIKFLREQNVHDDGLHLSGVVFIDEKTHQQMAGSIVHPQDILMNITGASIGRNALVADDFDEANVNQHVLIIRLVDKALRHYLHYCLCAPFVLNQMFSKQIGDKPGLSAKKVENFLVPLPPLAEQHRIVSRVNELLAMCDDLKEKCRL